MNYKTDEEKMKVALEQAIIAKDNDEVPVGAAIFDIKDNLICANHNRRELDKDPTSHAEILVLQEAARITGSWRLKNTTLAVTLEPDAMCAGAIVNARVSKLIYGAANLKAGAAYSLYNIPQDMTEETYLLSWECGQNLERHHLHWITEQIVHPSCP